MGRRNRKHSRRFKQQKAKMEAHQAQTQTIKGNILSKPTSPAPALVPGKCICKGPGSPEQKWASHISTCPASPNYGKPIQGGYTKHSTCIHWQDEFKLEDRLTILASAWSDKPTGAMASYLGPKPKPDLGFYLDKLWTQDNVLSSPGVNLPWVRNNDRVIIYPWADYQEPDSIRQFDQVCKWLLERIEQGLRVDTGCFGGHGRTGTLLACLLVTQGVKAWDAIQRVREEYCFQAIESSAQEHFIEDFDERVNQRPVWRKFGDPIDPTYPNKDTYTKGYYSPTDGMSDDDAADYNMWLRMNNQAIDEHDPMKPLNPADLTDEEKRSIIAEVLDQQDWPKETAFEQRVTDRLDSLAQERVMCRDPECSLARCTHYHEGNTIRLPHKDNPPIYTEGPYKTRDEVANAVENQLYCLNPPCMYPDECNIDNGECFRAATDPTTGSNVRVTSDKGEWIEWGKGTEEEEAI